MTQHVLLPKSKTRDYKENFFSLQAQVKLCCILAVKFSLPEKIPAPLVFHDQIFVLQRAICYVRN